jgi:hypothetical protein
MEAIRQIAQVENNLLALSLPSFFQARRVEIIVMPADDAPIFSEQTYTEIRRRPSYKLKGTQIIGNIMLSVVPEEDWDALK